MMKFKLSENSVAPVEGDSEENPFVMKFDSKVYPRDVSALPDGLSVIYQKMKAPVGYLSCYTAE